eukprot:3414047-Pleurochrysis_carterae.AAC.1
MRWPLGKCASLVNADAGPVIHKPLVSTKTQTHLHPEWQRLILFASSEGICRRSSGRDDPRRTHPGLGSRRGSLDVPDVHFPNFYDVHTSFELVSVGT